MNQIAGLLTLGLSYVTCSSSPEELALQLPFAALTLGIYALGFTQGYRVAGQITIYSGLFAFLSMSQVGTEFSLPGIALVLMGIGMLVYQRAFISSLTAPYLIMMVLALPIAIYSGGSGSAKGWSSWFEQFGITPAQAEAIIWVFRKFIHVTYYGSLAWTAYRYAIRENKKLGMALCIGVVWCACHAGFDEWRQSVTPDRSGSVIDFSIDLSGAALFLGIDRFRSARRANPDPSAS